MSIFNPGAAPKKPAASPSSNSPLITFEDSEKSLATELLTSSTEFTKEDVRTFANLNVISVESASGIIANMEAAVVKLDKDMKKNVLHKKALILLAKENNDPNYKALLDMYAQKQKIFEGLESKYGQQARMNQGTLIGKLMNKLRGSPEATATEAARKIADFQ